MAKKVTKKPAKKAKFVECDECKAKPGTPVLCPKCLKRRDKADKPVPNPVGRPPMFKTAEELQAKVDEYFVSGMNVREVVVGRGENETVIQIPIPTITGLVLFCGFCDRISFYDMEKLPKFTYTIKRARTMIEQRYEEAMQGKNPAGPIFALKNLGWSDKSEIEHSGDLNVTVVKYGKGK